VRQHRAQAPDGFPVPGQAMAGGLRVRITPSSRAWAWVRARAARLTLANALVTLNFTMWGITTERFKTGLILVVATVTLCLAWFFLPHFSFVVFVACVSAAGLFMLCRDAWRQVHRVDPPPPQPRAVARARGRRFRGAEARAQRRGEVLHPAATVTLSDERAAAGVDDVFADLDRELVGLLPVKKKVEEIAALLLVDRVRQRFGLTAPRPNLHMCFTGEPGTGKTTVALRMADLLHRLGYLESGHLVHAMRNDLVGEFIGHTAPKTRRVLDRAMGGVLFIDEAYYLYRASDSRDYGQECIDILLQVMENDRDKLVIILAGYKNRMDEFFECNPGMSSRIAHHIDFAPYQLDELMAIGQAMLGQASYYLSDQAEAVFREYLTFQMGQPRFANARSVRNELERARLRHAHRLAANPQLSRSRDDLMRLEPLDILTSPVFSLSAIDE
jgi:probable Rubsico expression protein CbbX